MGVHPPGSLPGVPGALGLLAAAAGSLALVAWNLAAPSRPVVFLLAWGAAFGFYTGAVWAVRRLPPTRRAFLMVSGAALVLRGILLPAPPVLSDDVYRYVWDGRVQRAGWNPYRFAPAAPELASLRDENWERINHKEIPTIYPPLMQGVFRLAAGVAPGVPGMKAMMALFEMGVLLLVWSLVRLAGAGPRSLAVYAWNPLVALEVGGSAHNDVVGVFFLLLALWAIIQGRRVLSTTALAASILAKLAPILLLPGFARRTPGSRLWILPVLLAVGVAAYAAAGPAMLAGLGAYLARWEHNDLLFRGILAAAEWADPAEPLTRLITWVRLHGGESLGLHAAYGLVHPDPVARGASLALAAAIAVMAAFRRWAPTREALVTLSAALLLSPTVHPWYLLWITPLLALHPSRGLLAWTALVPLAYLLPSGDGTRPPTHLLLWLEYVPVLLLLAADGIRRRRGRW